MSEKHKGLKHEIQNGEKFLKGLLSHENPNDQYYRKLIDYEEKKITSYGRPPETDNYSEIWTYLYNNRSQGFYKDDWKHIKERLQGHTLIDLGSGWHDNIAKLAGELNAKTYIGVDRYLLKDPKTDLFNNVESEQTASQDIRVIRVQADILDFVSRLPDDSANFSINGMDEAIIINTDYNKALRDEIIRATRKNGIVFGIHSTVLYNLKSLHDSNIKLVPLKMCEDDQQERLIFEKADPPHGK